MADFLHPTTLRIETEPTRRIFAEVHISDAGSAVKYSLTAAKPSNSEDHGVMPVISIEITSIVEEFEKQARIKEFWRFHGEVEKAIVWPAEMP